MKSRCYDTSSASYKYYGARGITVCDRWLESFPAFLEDMGRRPSLEHSIDRIDTNGNYEPSNCRWATRHQQARNRRNNVLVEYQGEQMCISELLERIGDSRDLVRSRIERGWDVERALSEPVIDKHHSRDGAFYRVPISKRTPEWYREYARREKEFP